MAYENIDDKLKMARQGFAVVSNQTPAPLPNLPLQQLPTPFSPQDQVSGGMIQSGDRTMAVTPVATFTNFLTGRDIGVVPQQKTPLATTPTPVPLPPPITALTRNAQIEDMARQATGLGPLDATGKPVLDPVMAANLAQQTRQGGPIGARAQQQLQDLGITASTGILLGETNEMQRAKRQQAIVNGQILPPAERKLFEQDQARAKAILTTQRDRLWEEDKKKMEFDIKQAELGYKQAQIAKTYYDINKETQTAANEAIMFPINKAIKETELSKTGAELKRDAEFDAYLSGTEQPPRPQPTTQTANEVEKANTISDVKQTWNQTQNLATRFNIPDNTRNRLFLGELVSSYDNPMELVRDVGVELPETIASVSQSKIADYANDIRDAIAANLPPDEAVKKILADSKMEPTDKGYPQLAMDVATGVWQTYKNEGETALTESKATINQSKAATRSNVAAQTAALVQQLPYADAFRNMITTRQEAVSQALRLRDAAEASGTKWAGRTPEFQAKVLEQFGLNKMLYSDQDSDTIKSMILTNLMESNKGNPSIQGYIADQMTKENRDPALEQFLDAGVIQFREGKKSAQAEYEKTQKEHKAEDETNDKQGYFTFRDPDGKVKALIPKDSEGVAEMAILKDLPTWAQDAVIEGAKERGVRITQKLAEEVKRDAQVEKYSKSNDRILKQIKLLDEYEASGTLSAAHRLELNAGYVKQIKYNEGKIAELTGATTPQDTGILGGGETKPITPPTGVKPDTTQAMNKLDAALGRSDISEADRNYLMGLKKQIAQGK